MNSLLKISIIIPTYNRPDDLAKCIDSILKQTVKPQEIIVVDDGDLQSLPFISECKTLCIGYRYHKKKGNRGPAASRNIGARQARGDIVFFFDDDVVLFSNYIEEIMKVYDFHPERAIIGGVGGIIANTKQIVLFRRLFHMVFLISSTKPGKILPSGFSSTDMGPKDFIPGKITQVDFLPGGVCSFRKEIFSEFLFPEDYREYSRGEDKEFSYRVSRKYKLFVNPGARLLHNESPKEDYNSYKKGWDFVMSRYLLFKSHLKKSPLHWFYFYYALSAYMLERAVIMILSSGKGERDRLKGIVDACIFALRHP